MIWAECCRSLLLMPEAQVQFAAELAVARVKAEAANATAADKARFAELAQKLVAFDYNDDLDGANCPRGAHIRRMNPRSSLEFGVKAAFATPGALSNRSTAIFLQQNFHAGDDLRR